MTEPVPPQPPIDRWRQWRPTAAMVVLLAAGGSAIVGTFAPLFTTSTRAQPPNGPLLVYAVTSWHLTITRDGELQQLPGAADVIPPLGIPAVIAGVVALLAAALLLLGSRGYVVLAARARMVGVLAAGLLVGAVSALGICMIGLMAPIVSNESGFEIGTGLWVLIASAALGIVGAVLVPSMQPVVEDVPEEPESVIYELEAETPPFGFPAQ